jgi:iron complex transport system substrate-binding protein
MKTLQLHSYLPLTLFLTPLAIILFSTYSALTQSATNNTVTRIAIAGGSITEIIYRLGEQNKIVGVDSTSQFPAAAKDHPLLGYVRNVSAEGVLSLSPDLFIGEADTGPTKTVNQIKATGIQTVIIKKDDTLIAIKNKIRTVAKLINVPEKGEALINDINVDIDALAYARQQISTTPRVLFLLSLANGAPIAAGNSTSAHTAIIEAGGVNVLHDEPGWKKLSPESAIVLNPDVIIVMNRGEDVLSQVSALPYFSYSTAVKKRAVFSIDGNYLLGFGPRTPQAIVELGTMIHPVFPLPEDYQLRYPSQSGDNTEGH